MYTELITRAVLEGEPFIGCTLESRMGRGLVRTALGSTLEASRDFHWAHTHWRGLIEPGMLLGRAYLRGGTPEAAARAFEEMYRESGERDDLAKWISLIYYAQDMFATAIAWAEKVGDSDTRKLYESAALLALRRVREALRLARAVDASRLPPPADSLLYLVLAPALWENLHGRVGEASAREIHELLEVSSKAQGVASPRWTSRAWKMRALALGESGQIEEAREALAHQPTGGTQHLEAQVHLDLLEGRPATA